MLRKALVVLAAGLLAGGALGQEKVLRVVPHSNLAILDPVWTTAVVTRNNAFLIYDQICAQNAAGEIKPQMAEGWTTENGGLSWTFTLRQGLKFHDGEPVRAAASTRPTR